MKAIFAPISSVSVCVCIYQKVIKINGEHREKNSPVKNGSENISSKQETDILRKRHHLR